MFCFLLCFNKNKTQINWLIVCTHLPNVGKKGHKNAMGIISIFIEML